MKKYLSNALALLLAVCLCCGLCLSASAITFTDAHGNEIELDDTLEAYTANTLLGADNAARSGETNLGDLWTDALRWFAVSGAINGYFEEDDVAAGITALQDQALTLEDGICEACLAAAKAQLDAGYPVRMPLICTRPQELSAHHAADLAALSDALMRVPFDNPTPYEQVLMTIPSRMMRTGGAVLVTARLTSRVADMALKLRAGGARIRLVWVSEEAWDESLQMLERLKMDGVEVERVDPLREGQ